MKKVLISGASGFLGSAVTADLRRKGYRVVRLVRSRSQVGEDAIFWDPEHRILDKDDLEGFDAIIHLSGENVANARWTEAKKQRIRNSRVFSTRLLCETVAEVKRPPQVLLCASAVGYYGDRDDTMLVEESPRGSGFLADVVVDWERATLVARARGIRVVNLRFGVVLGSRGGMLKRILTPFLWCLGGIIGKGKQYVSWIAIDDVLGVIDHVMHCKQLEGPVNAVSPNPVKNQTLTKILGKVLGRPTCLPMPAFLAKLLFGERAETLLLASTRVYPQKLLDSGYVFQLPDCEEALRVVTK